MAVGPYPGPGVESSGQIDLSAFRSAAVMLSHNGRVSVQALNAADAMVSECVYLWIAPSGECLRAGTSQSPLWNRLKTYPGYINRRLDGMQSVTPDWEARLWIEELEKHSYLLALAHQPPTINTPAGPVRCYLDLERAIIRILKPKLNRSRR